MYNLFYFTKDKQQHLSFAELLLKAELFNIYPFNKLCTVLGKMYSNVCVHVEGHIYCDFH